jgi:competence ComEA-like helix-hairpin-helix protein
LHIFAAKCLKPFSDGIQAVFNQRFAHPGGNKVARRVPFFQAVLFCYALAVVGGSSCVKLPRHAQVVSSLITSETAPTRPAQNPLININTASREELEKLPGIGEGIAARIVEHRARHGAFRRVEHLLMVRGISERRFKQLRAFVAVE